MATDYLIKQGHQKIGCITAEPTLDNVINRLAGYRKALLDNKIDYNNDLIISDNFSIKAGMNCALKLIDKKVTAIFAFNDLIAAGAYKICKTHGMIIPNDVSIIGYDDIIISEILDTPLTTIHQPIEAIARETVTLLLNRIDKNELYKKDIIIQPWLVERQSVLSIKKT